YAVQETQGTQNEVGSFIGTPNNGDLSFTLEKSNSGYNLTGNPYPSNLNIDELYTDNSNSIDPTFYFWDNRGNEEFTQQGSDYQGDHYAKYNALGGTGTSAAVGVGASYEERIPTKNVKAMTAFMVQVKGENTNGNYPLNFHNTQRLTDNGPGFFGKNMNNNADSKHRYWLSMETPGGIRVMNAVVYFEGGNDDFWLDDTESFGGSDDLYTITDGHQLSIQGKSTFDNNDKLMLGYRAFDSGTHILSVYEKEGVFAEDQDIFIIDRLLNKVVNLSVKPYKFMSRAGEYNNRFKIVYRPQFSTSTNIPRNVIDLFSDNGRIQIHSSIDRLASVKIFDLNSRPLFEKTDIYNQRFSVDAASFAHQIAVVLITTETGEVLSRKFV
ncbi:MAG: hypothetical protein PHO74_06505, partial [Weeksellaceae bacterium]|nr:hypothetical protein [Weeksellaceae bacterium]